MALWKVVNVFEAPDERGWEEVLYLMDQGDNPGLSGEMLRLAGARAKLLGAGCKLVGWRVSVDGVPFAAQSGRYVASVQNLSDANAAAGPPGFGLNLRLSDVDQKSHRTYLLRGLPQDWIPGDALNKPSVSWKLSPQLKNGVERFESVLTQTTAGQPNNWAIRARDPAAPAAVLITAVTRSLSRDTYTITAPGFTGVVGDMVAVTKMRGEGMCALNGTALIITVDAPLNKYELSPIACDPCAIDIKQLGTVRKLQFFGRRIRRVRPGNFASRRTGDGFFLTHGRPKACKC